MLIGEYEDTVEIIPDEEPVPKPAEKEREPIPIPPPEQEDEGLWAS